MQSADFIHLHNHSEYSLLDGMLRITDGEGHPSEFLKSLSDKKIPALAITDHGNMYGAMEFYFTARPLNLKPIIGCEVYTTRGSRLTKDKSTTRRDIGHMTVLVRNYKGYLNLMKMVSKSYTEGFYHDPRVDNELLSQYHEGLVFLSGCLKGHVARACAAGNVDEAAKIACEYRDIVGAGNFYLELMDHGIPEESLALKNLLEVAKKTGLPVVATNDCHYLKKEDWEAHDAHICISTGSQVSDPGRMRMSTHELYFKSQEEMVKLFSHTPQAVKNTLEIAGQCDLQVETGKLYLPVFKIPPEYEKYNADGKNEGDFHYLKDLCEAGLKTKVPGAGEAYRKRLAYELEVVGRMGFASYFLIVMDFIRYARANAVPVGPGRGSGAGSLVAFTLDITRVDPLVNGLLFERFLNPDRKSMPDLDIDFADDGREKVVEYVRQKYGAANVANIITYGTIKSKTAVRDVGRVMNISLVDVNAICKLIPEGETLYQAVNTSAEMKEYAQKDPNVRKMFEIAVKIEGLRRHTGVHAAGVLITKEELTNYTPLSNRNTKNVLTSQYDGNMLPKLGLLKVDFLGLRTLTIIETASKLIKDKDKDFDIYGISLEDEKTFQLLCDGRTTGVFQLESEGMKKLIKGLKPSQFSDVSALVALYRPGPIQSGMLEQFVDRKHGRKKIVYDHPLLEPILKDTYGTMVYQEQVMEISKSLGGFTPGEADGLRKAMGKKNAEVMEEARAKFVDGARKKDISQKLATKVFDQMAQFAGYGFNKSHSVAYALVAYQTAWLKANYPVEYMSAILTSEIGKSPIGSEDKENKLVTYVGEAQDMGIEILGPDVNCSVGTFAMEERSGKPALRFPLTAVKNVGEGVVEALVAERSKNGLFKSFEEFTMRADSKQLNKRVIESLAKAGAFDCLFPAKEAPLSRTRAIAAIDAFVAGSGKPVRDANQDMLFAPAADVDSGLKKDKGPHVLSEHAILKNEREVLGFYFSGHPLNSFRRQISMLASSTVEKVLNGGFEDGAMVRVAGIVSQFKAMQTKKGDAMAKLEIEDLTGNIGVCLFPKKYAVFGSQMSLNKMVVISGRVQKSNFGENAFELIAEEAMGLYEAMNKWGKNLLIELPEGMLFDEKQLSELKSAIGKSHGYCPVYLRVQTKAKNAYVIETGERVAFSEVLFRDIEKLLGDKTWQVESGF
ncbi:MAG: DNA polymerase III subunit alpha [Elusimicrobia bacterium GWF2_52_66]|nr:MAG: DNA polymerase III subunit alpha [Elusimicrobia bacterium GWA2_51_34]OGR84456.1 MAG: DNA polymerase III subunit alpha [Elusimicrobia bacterium GWF2_52_66]HAF94640.1 DNA polymerase III subunit alpha [Elusimicrobiota bacterium]HCE98982.1 DNA polymerase III subunit alpha [Elusimicrobiota bacterium]